eukprot:2970534-Amphidinium_carterae.1
MAGHAAPSSSRLQQLISRTRCAKCGVIGHWARDCKSGGNSTQGSRDRPPFGQQSFANYFIAHGSATETRGTSNFGMFVGLMTKPEQGVVDTGAQGAVIGELALERLSRAMAERGVQPVDLPLTDFDTETKGIGGKALVTKKVSIPIGISKTAGLVTALVVSFDVPLLLHVELLQTLGMVLNLPKSRAYWTTLNRTSTNSVERSGHLTLNIFDYPHGGGCPPRDSSRIAQTSGKSSVWLMQNMGSRTSSVYREPPEDNVGCQSSLAVELSTTNQHTKRDHGIGINRTDQSTASIVSESPSLSCLGEPDAENGATISCNPADSKLHPAGARKERRSNDGECATQSHKGRGNVGAARSIQEQSGRECDRLSSPRCIVEGKGEQKQSMVDMHGLRSSLAPCPVAGKGSERQRHHADRKVRWATVSSDPSSIQDLGIVSGGGRRRPGGVTRVTALFCLGALARSQCGSSEGTAGRSTTSCFDPCAGSSHWLATASGGSCDGSDGCEQWRGVSVCGCRQPNIGDVCRTTHPLVPSKREWIEQQIGQYVQDRLLKKQCRQALSARGVCLGLHTRRGAWVTKATREHPQLLEWCHTLASEHGMEYTSIQINIATAEDEQGILLHKDKFNLTGYPNLIYVLNTVPFAGGRLWQECQGVGAQKAPSCLQTAGEATVTKGKWQDVRGKWMGLDPHRWHGVEPVKKGCRVSIITFVPGSLQRVKSPVWQELHELGFPCRTIRDLSTPEGDLLWRMWHQTKNPKRSLFASEVDGETVLWHHADLGLSRVLVSMGHTPHKLHASKLNLKIYPDQVKGEHEIWVYESNSVCGFCGMEDEEPSMLNHHQRDLIQHRGSLVQQVCENQCLLHGNVASKDIFPVLLEPDEELQSLEVPEAEGEDLPAEEDAPEWLPSDHERTAIQHAHDNAGHPSKRRFVRLLKQGGARPE